MRTLRTLLAAAVLGLAATADATPLKVYISADMEGVAGVVTPDQLGPAGFEYERVRGCACRGRHRVPGCRLARQRGEPADREVPQGRPDRAVHAAPAHDDGG